MRSFSKAVYGALAAIMMIGATGVGQAADLKIAYVDVNAALQNTIAYQQGMTKIKALKDSKQKELDAMAQKITQAQKDMMAQSMAMSPDRQAAKQQELAEMRKNYERTQQDAQDQLDSERNRLSMSVGSKLKSTLESFGKEGGYDIILPRPVMLYVNPKYDVTAEITKRLDKK